MADGLGKGLWLKVDPQSEEGYASGFAEPGVQAILSKHLKRGDCFYDVGAHIGFYSVIAARLVGKSGLVIAFEPDPDNVKVLQKICTRNNLDHICALPAAVWNQGGRVQFQRGKDPSRMTGRVVSQNVQLSGCQLLSCPAVALDTFSASNRPPTFVKIDVEGGELMVLKGAQTTLRSFRPTLLVEIHDKAYIPAILDSLSPLGYLKRHISTQPEKTLVCFERQVPEMADSGKHF